MVRFGTAWLAGVIAGLGACASVPRDPWTDAPIVFQDGQVIGRMVSKRSSDGLELSWIGVRSEGERLLRSVTVILFHDQNGDLEPQPEEQFTRWAAGGTELVREFSVNTTFAAENVQPDVLAHMCVFTEVAYDEASSVEKASETRALP